MARRHGRTVFLFVTAIALLGGTGLDQAPGSQGSPRSQEKSPPHFDDFPVVGEFHGKPGPVDLSSHPDARTFQTRLRQGAQKGANFAGNYALVSWGCGNECQGSLIIDLRTGKVFGLAESASEPSGRAMREILDSSRGVNFKLTSKQLIVDPPCSKDYKPSVSFGRSQEPVRYYIMENDGLRLIHKTPCRLVNEKQQCD